MVKPPVQELAATCLREHPTIPPRAALDDVNAGSNWPAAFCAFAGCMWEEQNGTEDELEYHLQKEHAEELLPICKHMLRESAPDAMKSVYNQAIAVKCRQQPPLAGASLDRTALRTFTDATKGAKVEALICFCCGGIHPYVEEVKDQGSIKWHQPVQRSDSTGELLFLDNPMEEVKHLLGLQMYLERYNTDSQRPNTKLTDHESFEDWQLKLPGLEDSALICCPEAGGLLHRTMVFDAKFVCGVLDLFFSLPPARTIAAASRIQHLKFFARTAGCPSVKTATATCQRSPGRNCRP